MENAKLDRLSTYATIKKQLSGYSFHQIEDGIMRFCLNNYHCNDHHYNSQESAEIEYILRNSNLETDLETIIELFESLLEENNKDENGIVFTPQYIAEYIAKNLFEGLSEYDEGLSIIDPGCGYGIFLITVAETISSRFNIEIDTVINNNIYGIDIDADNVRRCNLILKLLCAKHGCNYNAVTPNVLCRDSLKCKWTVEFGIESFDYIIGNPPYVNLHDMNKETVRYLKETFSTTRNGVFNIFYAFIEHAVSFLGDNGLLGYIIPNNFLTIKSALKLREYLQVYRLPKRILDFGDNMVFKPVRTYNCIIILSKQNDKDFEYSVMEKAEDIKEKLSTISFEKMPYDRLDKNGWNLVDQVTFRNLRKIESQMISIKEFIRTGIATLRDGVYLVECDNNGYFKQIGTQKFYIEPDLVKPIYKISDLKHHDNIDDAKRYIIFPYVKSTNGYTLIDESVFLSSFPLTYECLSQQREELDSRDKGKRNPQGWYAYGRTQGLNKYGKKLLFPTFANKPKFIYVDDEDALFCNGYAVFENDRYTLNVLQKVLNSRLMDYYVRNTSYSIEGGYYCYQKKYVERFSLPWFSESDIEFILGAPEEELNIFLWNYYNLE
ncbi:MAG: N-6 DNA methylase [Ruminococcus bromii]|nr:N-6 DNA methylase [Ruminococcus bromii]MDY4711248.1 N-6 DNA methylase [Ruminococcus bromii]